jgi:putative PIN family toxin of toxin-antitoxin system
VKAVFDTNVQISAFVFPGGGPEMAFRAALSGRVALVTSPALLAEFGRVLGDKFSWENHMLETAVAQVARVGTVVRPQMRVSVIGDDPADDRVLEAAKEGTPDVIVSGDRHLLRLGTWETIRIVRVKDLLEELEG